MRLSPATALVECADAQHRLVWQDGVLTAADHRDPDRERALTALGGEAYRCLQLLDVWDRHADDLDVLVLASRGAADRLAVSDEAAGHHHVHGRQGHVRYHSFASLGTLHAGFGASASASASGDLQLVDVLRLGGGLPDRLVAQVVAAWSARLAHGDDAVEAARPRLHAALYGRFAAVVREWLGEPGLRIDLESSEPGSTAVLHRTDSGLDVRLPFAWLADVWLPGLAVVADRLVVSATQPHPDRVELDTLDRTLARRATVTVEVRDQ